MADITFRGSPIHTSGQLPSKGSQAKDFKLVDSNLGELSLSSLPRKKKVFNIFVSVDTPVCAASVRRFNETVGARGDAMVLNISADLPFAQQRFCGAEGIENVKCASTFRGSDFGEVYGVTITDGPLAGLLSRAVVILDENNKVIYTEQVPEIGQEPDYDAALAALGEPAPSA